MEEFDDDLFGLIQAHVPPGTVIATLSNDKPNTIVEVRRSGVLIETERSATQRAGPQLVPAWMFQDAWSHLRTRGRLTNKELLATDGLNVKRSSAVCAVLARLPGIVVESVTPIVLRMD